MNRHEDELEKETADKYIENMAAPDLWGRIEAGLDAVDAQRTQDKELVGRHEVHEDGITAENRTAAVKVTDIRIGREDGDKILHNKGKNRKTAQIISGLVAAAVVCVLIIAGPLRNSRKTANEKSVQENSAMLASDENAGDSDMVAESDAERDAAPADKTQSNDAQMSDSAPESFVIQKSQEYQDEAPGDYAPMIMVSGVLYKDTYDMVEADSVDESNVFYAESYTDGTPANDGEVNFDRNPSKNSAYVVCDDGSLIVKVEGNWYRFERAD